MNLMQNFGGKKPLFDFQRCLDFGNAGKGTKNLYYYYYFTKEGMASVGEKCSTNVSQVKVIGSVVWISYSYTDFFV